MPRYDYQCTTCGRTVEVNQRMTDAPLTDCECGQKGSLKRLLSAGSGLIFKGTGFYQTDYKGGSSNGSAPKPTEVSTDSKPAASGGHSCGAGCGCA